MSVLLNSKHEDFAYHLAKGLNLVSAYKLAFGTTSYSHSSELAKKPEIQERVQEIKQTLRSLQEFGLEEVKDYLVGILTTPIADIDEHSIYATEVEITENEKSGTTKKKVKAYPKDKALEQLGKLAGSELFKKDEVQVTVTPEAEFLHAIRSGKTSDLSE